MTFPSPNHKEFRLDAGTYMNVRGGSRVLIPNTWGTYLGFFCVHFVCVCVLESGMEFLAWLSKKNNLENIGKYHFSRQLWLVLGVKLMEINSNLFSRKLRN